MKGVSISTTVFGPKGKTRLPLGDALRHLAEAGYTCIEISRRHDGLTTSAGLIASLGLRVWAVHGTLNKGHLLEEEQRRACVAREIVRMWNAAPWIPCHYVIHYTSRFNDPQVAVAFRRSIEELLPTAEALQLTMAIETVPDKASNERYPDSREVANFARSFGHPLVQVCIDVNHSNIGENLTDVISNCSGAIATIHVSDNHGRFEDHLPPGEGSIDLPGTMRAIADAGYVGPLNMEFHTPDYPSQAALIAAREWAETTVADLV